MLDDSGCRSDNQSFARSNTRQEEGLGCFSSHDAPLLPDIPVSVAAAAAAAAVDGDSAAGQACERQSASDGLRQRIQRRLSTT